MKKRVYVRGPIERRFWAHVEKSDGCWLWKGARQRSGHGNVNVGGGKHDRAHRVSYRLTYGDIPSGMVVRHRCDNSSCVRPDHLELGTQADNVRDMWERGQPRGLFEKKKFCHRGHLIEPTGRTGRRRCRQCNNGMQRLRRLIRSGYVEGAA